MPDKPLDVRVDEMIASAKPDGEPIDLDLDLLGTDDRPKPKPPRIRCNLCGEILTNDSAKQCDVLGVRGKAGRPDPAIAISDDAERIADWIDRLVDERHDARPRLASLAARIRAGEWRR